MIGSGKYPSPSFNGPLVTTTRKDPHIDIPLPGVNRTSLRHQTLVTLLFLISVITESREPRLNMGPPPTHTTRGLDSTRPTSGF